MYYYQESSIIKLLFRRSHSEDETFVILMDEFSYPLNRRLPTTNSVKSPQRLEARSVVFPDLYSAVEKSERHSVDNSLMVIDWQFINGKPQSLSNHLVNSLKEILTSDRLPSLSSFIMNIILPIDSNFMNDNAVQEWHGKF